jgi:hypothetical protein
VVAVRPQLLLLGAPYLDRALVEILLLAALAGVLGSWIVLRRLAFYTTPWGTATFPGLVVAGPWGVAPQVTALAAALGSARPSSAWRAAGGSTRARPPAAARRRTRRRVGARVDVYEAGAGVDRLLFGTLIGLEERDLWLTALAVAAALASRRPCAARGSPRRSIRAARGSLGFASRWPTGPCSPRWPCGGRRLDAVGALLVAVVLVVPAATVRLFARERAHAAARDGRARRHRRPGGAGARHALNVGPGPVMAFSAGRLRGAALLTEARADEPRGNARSRGGYAPGTTPCDGVTFAVEAGEAVGVLGPTGAARRRCSAPCSGELPHRHGSGTWPGARRTSRRRSAHGSTSPSAPDVALMGAFGRTPWYRRLARADRHAAAAGARAGRARGPRPQRFGALSAASASAC